MADIFDYLHWRGDLRVEQDGFNEIDALVLARLSYAPFDRIALHTADVPTAIWEAAGSLLKAAGIEQAVLWKHDIDLLRTLAKSERYRNMLLHSYVNQIEEDTQKQFSAITVQIGEKLNFVSFRGTDNTLVGWKEDFNMCFTCPVPAQKSAVEYLEAMASSLNGNLIVGGHSKGGNLAVYAAAFCKPEIQKRIITVYNFDGPGFEKEVLSTAQYGQICGRIKTFIPQSSIVGLLLEHEEQYIIVKSIQKIGFLQHDLYSWTVERNHLCYLNHVTNSSKFLDHTLKGWVADMTPAQREELIDALYSIIQQTNAHTLRELGDNWFVNAKTIHASIKSLDEPTRNKIMQSLSLLVKNAGNSIKKLYEACDEIRDEESK